MNIFVLDTNPKLSAQYMCDKHVIKMILESCQLLSTAIWVQGFKNIAPAVFSADHKFCKPTHINHPSGKWVRESFDNFMWLVNHGKALCEEKRFRYYNRPPHVMEPYYDRFTNYTHLFPQRGLTPFAQAMPDAYKDKDAVKAYKSYYINEKHKLLTYTRRQVPDWLHGIAKQK